MSTKISFITFTRNSGKRLKLLLENVKDVVDEVVVIDGYSTDDTVEMAKSYGARVFQRKPWGHVEPDRMFALSKASYNWILYLDDDELLGRKLKSELRDLVEKAERERYVALSTIRVDYDKKCRQVVLGPYYNRQIRIYKKDKVLYRGVVHELPIVDGKILELAEEYYILHYPSFSKSKLLFYAYLESLEFYRYRHNTRSNIRKALWMFTPLSAPMIITYNTYHLVLKPIMKKTSYVNSCTIMRIINTFTLYEILVQTLTKFRGRRRELISKLISEHGLIRLLEHAVSYGVYNVKQD
jgi:glycosyltransferase involved in cell wall biosynthesis